MSYKKVILLSAFCIAFASLANLIRFFWNIPVTIGSLVLPGWSGALLYIALGLLACWTFRALRVLCAHLLGSPSDL